MTSEHPSGSSGIDQRSIIEAIAEKKNKIQVNTQCAGCNKFFNKISQCDSCGIFYCSTRCQIGDWEHHKKICKDVKAQKNLRILEKLRDYIIYDDDFHASFIAANDSKIDISRKSIDMEISVRYCEMKAISGSFLMENIASGLHFALKERKPHVFANVDGCRLDITMPFQSKVIQLTSVFGDVDTISLKLQIDY